MGTKKHFRTIFVVVVFLLLLVSIDSYHYIPFWSFWGFDLHNLVAFHNCVSRNNPYAMPHEFCGDQGGRAMFYPPFLYWSFVWTRWIPTGMVNWAWSLCNLLGMLLTYWLWCRVDNRRLFSLSALLFWILLLPQYPFFFTLERGNSDMPALLLWSLGSCFFLANYFFFAGAALTLAALYKIYPVIPLAVISFGLVFSLFKNAATSQNSTAGRKPLLTFIAGCVTPILLQLILVYDQTQLYFLKVLPIFAGQSSDLGAYSHSLKPLDSYFPHLSLVLKIVLLLSWVYSSTILIKKDPPLILAGAFAISTFFPNTSYEYNLISCYPLLFLLFLRAKNRADYLWTFLGIFLMLGHRGIWPAISSLTTYPTQYLRVLLEVSWLIVTPPLILQGICSKVGPEIGPTVSSEDLRVLGSKID